MPWYLNTFRVSFSALYGYFTYVQARWIAEAEDRYRRSMTWRPAVGTICDHKIVIKRGGSSHVRYKFEVGGVEYVGERFRSGGIHCEEALKNPTLLGTGTQLVIYYNPADPHESAMSLRTDRAAEATFAFGICLTALLSYRAVRCETILPNMFYQFLSVNRRVTQLSGLRQARKHSCEEMKYGKHTGAL